MTNPLPNVDFRQIRPYGQPASRSSGFEELASILIEHGAVDWPSGTRFHRFGNPDGGREAKAVLPNGDVWAWQAKYLFEFDSSAAGQVTSSVRRVLESEPDLKRYFVAMPLDMPAGDTKDRTSAHTRWTEKVSEWEQLARKNNLNVEFVFVGAHQLVTTLTEAEHAGRLRYWFGLDILTPEWQERRLEEAKAKAGRRYTPSLHVEVEAVRSLDAVGRRDAYVSRWQAILAELREARRWTWRPPKDAADEFAEALPKCEAALDEADVALGLMITAARSTENLPRIDSPLNLAMEAVGEVEELLHRHSLTKGGYFVGDAASLYSHIRDAIGALWQARELANAAATHAARDKVLLVTGRAGVGKTHLLCDVATRRTADGYPTVVLLGQDFDGRSLLSQISERTQLGGTLDDILGVLDAAAEAFSCTALLIIDALNESERAERWRDESRALLAAATRFSHIAVVLSCRLEFVEKVIGDHRLPTVEHVGFAEATDVAVQRFTREFGLEPPTFPLLNPEFSNPLFLKLTCEALSTLGRTRFPFGSAGLTTIYEVFLEAVNKRLSEPDRCDYDEHSDTVGQAIREIALLGPGPLDRADVQRITDRILPGHSWSRSLMNGLISEGILLEIYDRRIVFGYQRLGDMTRAGVIAERGPDGVRAWLQQLDDDVWREAGVLAALAVIVPERHGQELVILAADDEGRVSYHIVDSFLESLLLRAPESISPRAVEIVQRLLDDGHRVGEIWDRLFRLACVSGNPLNAEWLHARLAGYEVADRDRIWSEWLVDSASPDDESPVRRLLEWAWPADLESRAPVPDDVANLATLTLGWLLTTTDRRVRDRATKALVSVGERAPQAFASALKRFRGTNDPYVLERLVAAGCGVVLRSSDASTVRVIADGVLELLADGWPVHLMTRDYARRTFAVAHTRGWSGPASLPPYGATWPLPTTPADEIEVLAGPPDYAYASIWHSLTGMGDFGRYILQSALRNFETKDAGALQREAAQAIFDRVLELGWTPERFGEIDRSRPGASRFNRVVERVGKKYQWIGFYEVLGRIADHHGIQPRWSDEERGPYASPEQLVWRDIDPTVLVRKPAQSPTQEHQWFSPVEARFPPGVSDDYPIDMSGAPDPLDLIAVSDPSTAQWLVVVSEPDWKQPLAVEIEALRVPRRQVWMGLRAYLVPLADMAALRAWAGDKDWSDGWMPAFPNVSNVLLGAHPDDPAWAAADGEVDGWRGRGGHIPPVELIEVAAWYAGTGTSRDLSAEDETLGYVPSKRLLELTDLSSGVDFTWSDALGVAVCDPSATSGGPAALIMRRDLVARLAHAGLTLFWTVVVNSELHRSDYSIPDDDHRWVSATASYILTGGRVELIGARASRLQAGAVREREVKWSPRAIEDEVGGAGAQHRR
ncbi:MAG: ATP-binding protein [Dehalococcoidia bacterium]|nr:ATP-binding protein [Dehalococcoidia bacterium]